MAANCGSSPPPTPFGMGIDKPDVRLVDPRRHVPGSLENYLQEAGRAGRDQQAARCVLLYTLDDVERQFGMSARSRLTRREIHGVLRALRNLDRKMKRHQRTEGEVVATAGEILGEDEDEERVQARLRYRRHPRRGPQWPGWKRRSCSGARAESGAGVPLFPAGCARYEEAKHQASNARPASTMPTAANC